MSYGTMHMHTRRTTKIGKITHAQGNLGRTQLESLCCTCRLDDDDDDDDEWEA